MNNYQCEFCTKNIFNCHINRPGFVVFMKPQCPHSQKAMKTIMNINAEYRFYDITQDNCQGIVLALKKYLKTNKFTVPQIFFNGKYIGGNSDLQQRLNK